MPDNSRSARASKKDKPQAENAEEDTDEYYTEDWDALGPDAETQATIELGVTKLSQGEKELSAFLAIQRNIEWEGEEQRCSKPKQRLAALLYRRGDVAAQPCSRCKTAGDMKRCITAPVINGAAFQSGACSNCLWAGKDRSCTLRGTNMCLTLANIPQFLGKGQYDLRAAIADAEAEEKAESEEEEEEEDEDEEKEEQEESAEPETTRRIQTIPSSTFFGAFRTDGVLNRVGVSQRGPRCQFDGDELKFPISRAIWENPRRLLTARSDLAHFLSIADARLYELGEGDADSDYMFWAEEARRLPALYNPVSAPQNNNPRSFPTGPGTPPPRGPNNGSGGGGTGAAGSVGSRMHPGNPSSLRRLSAAVSSRQASTANRSPLAEDGAAVPANVSSKRRNSAEGSTEPPKRSRTSTEKPPVSSVA
ncbi:DUF3716 domain-containing protein [Aspergillus lucknowensis]|uniref:Uncharacterized protein n=1 Tax=Aspergillus lucknowensis TaxID=176173 RepID=A0ABR4LLC7_9EURO